MTKVPTIKTATKGFKIKIERKALELELVRNYPNVVSEAYTSTVEYYGHAKAFNNPYLIGVWDRGSKEFEKR